MSSPPRDELTQAVWVYFWAMSYLLEPIVALAELCAAHGLRYVVQSPGSRNAPLTLAFARHPRLRMYTLSDERSAAFVGLGLAQATGRATVLACTSGSAGLNYAPAVAEAYFQQVPLLVFTADRPPEWVDQLDGQTIRQRGLFGAHVKGAYELPVDYTHPDARWQVGRVVSEAINLAEAYPPGPVHINAPFREPFYPPPGYEVDQAPPAKRIRELAGRASLSHDAEEELAKICAESPKILLVAGQQRLDWAQVSTLKSLPVPLVADTIANLHPCPGVVRHHDLTLAQPEVRAQLGRPDLLVTFGLSVLSKPLKTYLRQHPPRWHWHVQAAGLVADPFQSLTHVARVSPADFWPLLAAQVSGTRPLADARASWLAQWQGPDQRASQKVAAYLSGLPTSQPLLSELEVVTALLAHLPAQAQLHLANSMPVRYVNALGMPPGAQGEVLANRGTSGIDGSVGTAVGHALATPDRLHVLLTGDLAFFYDRNSLWHNYLPQNLRILVLNNHGGGIFRLIDGPKHLPESAPYFVTEQRLTAQASAEDMGLRYTTAPDRAQLATELAAWLSPSAGAALLEVETAHEANEAAWQGLKAISAGLG
jgi:2-succinyl-5-enolpyruvyl-6-hydroxy-3-cyclohexene-1-carboxylate synthase